MPFRPGIDDGIALKGAVETEQFLFHGGWAFRKLLKERLLAGVSHSSKARLGVSLSGRLLQLQITWDELVGDGSFLTWLRLRISYLK
jgi:hypothetical protein